MGARFSLIDDHWRTAKQLRDDQGLVELVNENQSVIHWALSTESLANNDPPVLAESEDLELNLRVVHPTVSEFLFARLLLDTARAGARARKLKGPLGVLRKEVRGGWSESDKVLRTIPKRFALLPVAPLKVWPTKVTRFYGDGEVLIALLVGQDAWAAACSAEGWARLEALAKECKTRWE